MRKHLSKNLSMLALFIVTVTALTYIVQNLDKNAPPAPGKTIAKKEIIPAHRPQGLIKEALLPKQNEVEFCYESFLKTKPEVSEGSVTVRWLIDSDGSVLSTHLDQTEIEDETLTGCLLEKLKGLSFSPPSDHEAKILAYKFKFRRDAQAALSFAE